MSASPFPISPELRADCSQRWGRARHRAHAPWPCPWGGASRSVSGAGSQGSERRGAGSEGSEGSEAGSGTGSEGSPEIGTGSGIRSGAGSSGSGCPRCGPASPAPSAPRPWQDAARLATAKVTPRSWALLPCQLLLICCFVLFFNYFFFFFQVCSQTSGCGELSLESLLLLSF